MRDPRPEWDPARYELIPADPLDISGKYVDEREIKDGLGAPLVAKRVADQAHEYAPTPHFFYGVTAVARFKGPAFTVLDTRPIEVPHHSIIGDRGKGDTPNSADGVVEYSSSHLKSAKSETIIPGPHGACELPHLALWLADCHRRNLWTECGSGRGRCQLQRHLRRA